VSALLAGLDSRHHEVGTGAVGDERLRAVDQVAAVVVSCPGADGGDVGAGTRLRDAERGDLLSADGGLKEAPLLLLGAEPPDRRRGDSDVRADPGRQPAGAGARQLLGEHRVVDVGASLPAVLLRVLEPKEAKLPHTQEDLVWEPAGVLPFLGVGSQLAGDEAADGLPQHLVLVGEWRRRSPRSGRGQDAHRETNALIRSLKLGESFQTVTSMAPCRVLVPATLVRRPLLPTSCASWKYSGWLGNRRRKSEVSSGEWRTSMAMTRSGLRLSSVRRKCPRRAGGGSSASSSTPGADLPSFRLHERRTPSTGTSFV